MSTERSEAIQIDRLSLLPPELLSIIFDLSHDHKQPLREPLSKTLLPYFRQNLYRQIRISSGSPLSKFLTAVETTPSLAPLVQDLTVNFGGWVANTQIKSIAIGFTALKSLSLGTAQFSKVNFVAPLRSLSYTPLVFNSDEIDALARLPLIKLELKLYSSKIEIPDDLRPSTTMHSLEELTLAQAYSDRDDDQWDPEVSRFAKRCPKLHSLKLVDDTFPSIQEFLETLVGGVPDLTKLEFDTPALPHGTICSFTYLYPCFPNLTYLGLGDGTTAPNLASHLRQLSSLKTLSLGPDAHFGFESSEDLFSLVRASTKPPALELLILDCFAPKIGYQCDVRDMLLQREIDNSYFKGEWDSPNFSSNIEEEECRQLLELAKETDVRVEGDIHVAVDWWRLWTLEVANRHVLFAYQNQTLEQIKSIRNSRRGVRLRDPDLDLGELVPGNLKLVKINLPEEDWYQFTLE
ncbi:hypothetical protein JCM5350_003927 [Sporobolomyces pararoseus]